MIYDLLKAYAEQRKRRPSACTWCRGARCGRSRRRASGWRPDRRRRRATGCSSNCIFEQYLAMPDIARTAWRAPSGRRWRWRAKVSSSSRRPSLSRPSTCASARRGPSGSALSVVRSVESSEQNLQKKKGTEMVPPKLTVVPQGSAGARRRARGRNETASMPSEVLAHEGWRGLPSNVTHLPSADRREQLAHPGGAAVCRLRAAGRELPAHAPEIGRRRGRAAGGAEGLLRQPRHQPRQGRGQVGVPHGRGSLLPARAQRHRAAAPVEGGHGDAWR